MSKIVSKTSQMKVKLSNQSTRSKAVNAGKVTKVKRQLKDPLAGKTSGTGLDDYNLDVMNLD